MKIKNNARLWVTLLILVFTGLSSIQSQVIQEIISKLNLYQQKYPEEGVYLQTDRTTYSPGEVIWFKALILQELGQQTNSFSNDLFVALVDQDSLVIANGRYAIEDNRVEGNIILPQRLTSGSYMMIAHTEWMKNTPVDRVFAKEILIEKEEKYPLSINIRLEDTICHSGSRINAGIDMANKYGLPVSSSFVYRLTGPDGTISTGKGKTNKAGKAFFTVALPDFKTGDNLELFVDATYKGTASHAALVIPTPDNYLFVKFYPESGMLLYNADARIAFRAFNSADRPVDFEGAIYNRDNSLVKVIRSDYQGIGSFRLTPEKGQSYTLRITSPAGISRTFDLPEPRRSGIIMSVAEKSKDKITLLVNQVNKSPQVYHFFGQMKGKMYWLESQKIEYRSKPEVPLDLFPAGVAEITMFDTSFNLVAKRLVYVNEERKLNISITPDKTQYAPREKVSLALEVKDENGNPVEADLSFSATLKSFGQPLPDNSNLFTYTTLKSDLVGFIPEPAYYFTDTPLSDEVLDNLLIANAYKRFTWRDILNIRENSPSFKKPEEDNDLVIDMGYDKSKTGFFARDLINNGRIPGQAFKVQDRNSIEAILNPGKSSAPSKPGYDTYRDVLEIIFKTKPYQMIDGKIVFASSGPNTLLNQQGAAIAIDGVYRGTDPSVLTTILVSDVDHVNISTNPVDIQRYTGLNSIGIIEVFTKSGDISKRTSQPENTVLTENRLATGFKGPDYGNRTTRVKPKTDLRKTLHWDPSVQADKSGKANVSFYNGDITGEVVITVEGKTNTGLPGSNNISYKIK